MISLDFPSIPDMTEIKIQGKNKQNTGQQSCIFLCFSNKCFISLCVPGSRLMFLNYCCAFQLLKRCYAQFSHFYAIPETTVNIMVVKITGTQEFFAICYT